MTSIASSLLVLMLVLILVCGCSSKAPTDPAADQKLLLMELSQQHPVPISALWSLSRHSVQVQNYPTAWQSFLLLCQSETSLAKRHSACRMAVDVATVMQDEEAVFLATLNQYLFTSEAQLLPSLELMASSDSRRLLLDTANGQLVSPSAARGLDAASLGQWHYLSGKENSDLASLDQAILYFAQSSQPARVCDSLFLQAKLLWQQQAFASALKKAAQAALMSDSLDLHDNAAYIRSWVDAHNTAR